MISQEFVMSLFVGIVGVLLRSRNQQDYFSKVTDCGNQAHGESLALRSSLTLPCQPRCNGMQSPPITEHDHYFLCSASFVSFAMSCLHNSKMASPRLRLNSGDPASCAEWIFSASFRGSSVPACSWSKPSRQMV